MNAMSWLVGQFWWVWQTSSAYGGSNDHAYQPRTAFIELSSPYKLSAMNLLIFIGVLGVAAATGFILRYRGMNWFVAWLVASMVIPTILYVSEMVQPTGWLGVAILLGYLQRRARGCWRVCGLACY